ncbi:MAG: ABC transporter ATP-binding protein [Clostridiales bacterium]|nr:ABC transporter ATP-binding protein [Clostridiales bacterium]
MVALEGISKAFDSAPVLRGVSFAFPERAVTALSGPSGSGKTTLLNIMLGLVAPDEGAVRMPVGARMAAVFQEDRLIEHFSAARNLRLTTPKDISDREILEALRELDLAPDDQKRVAKYSGGMRRRVAIARAALFKPDVLLLDEPFTGLDEDARRRAVEFLKRRCGSATVVLVSHDRDEAALMGAVGELRLDGEGGGRA